LTDGGDSDAHYHSQDRNRSNHTGTQPASTISNLESIVQTLSSLQDGDKGDITVTAAGTTWTIDAQAVTFSKFQNINTNRLLGRTTASSGSVEEITPGTSVLTWIQTPTSANLRAALTDETGTGAAVFAGSPTFTGTANFGNVEATGSINAGASLTSIAGGVTSRVISSGTNSFWGTTSNHPTIWQTNNTTRLTVAADGTTWTWTTSPAFSGIGALTMTGVLALPASTWVTIGAALSIFSSTADGLLLQAPASANSVSLRDSSGNARVTMAGATGNVAITGGVDAGGGNNLAAKRSSFSANSEPYAIAAKYLSSGGAVYFGATDATGTPGFQISNAGGGNLLSGTNAGVISIPGQLALAGSAWLTMGGVNVLFSDTSNGVLLQMPGTTEKAVVRNVSGTARLTVEGDGRVYGSALHNNANAVTGTTNQYIASGSTTTITFTNVANASSMSGKFNWTRVGNVVTVGFGIDVTAGGAGNCEFRTTLPIASNITSPSAKALGGTGMVNGTPPTIPVGVVGDFTNDAAVFSFNASVSGAVTIYGVFVYEIL
jgi:hypothetical protein